MAAVRPARHLSGVSAWVAAVMLAVALGSTVLVQVPLHSRLARGVDPAAAELLVATNWVRTAAWTARGAVLAAVLVS